MILSSFACILISRPRTRSLKLILHASCIVFAVRNPFDSRFVCGKYFTQRQEQLFGGGTDQKFSSNVLVTSDR